MSFPQPPAYPYPPPTPINVEPHQPSSVTSSPLKRRHETTTATTSSSSYSRKDKSLGLLCENFINMYTGTGVSSSRSQEGISIDDAAKELGVERRRIYDIINILESIDMVSRKCKNTYNWHGVRNLDNVFRRLQKQAIQMWPEDAAANGIRCGEMSNEELQKAGKFSLKEMSLGRLSQKFVQLFLVGNEVVSLAAASEKILGSHSGESKKDQMSEEKLIKNKVRRLYDIANVLMSINIIVKVGSGRNNKIKPSFKWSFRLSPRDLAYPDQSTQRIQPLPQNHNPSFPPPLQYGINPPAPWPMHNNHNHMLPDLRNQQQQQHPHAPYDPIAFAQHSPINSTLRQPPRDLISPIPSTSQQPNPPPPISSTTFPDWTPPVVVPQPPSIPQIDPTPYPSQQQQQQQTPTAPQSQPSFKKIFDDEEENQSQSSIPSFPKCDDHSFASSTEFSQVETTTPSPLPHCSSSSTKQQQQHQFWMEEKALMDLDCLKDGTTSGSCAASTGEKRKRV